MEMLQSPVLVGFLSAETSLAATSTIYFSAIRDVCGARGKVGEENENLVYPSPWGFNGSLTCSKILRHGTSGFTSHPMEGVLRIFIALKNPSPLPG
jgi:hypothetical protein